MSDTVKFYSNERVDLEDMEALSESSRQQMRLMTECLFLPRQDTEAGYVLEGFEVTQEDIRVRSLRVAPGSAVLAGTNTFNNRDRGYLVFRGDSTQYRNIDMESLPAGEYGIWLGFKEEPGAEDNRVFWDATNQSEFSQNKKTRISGGFELKVSAINAAPGAQYIQIAAVNVAPGAQIAILDTRQFFFEGKASDGFAPAWGTNPGDREDTRQKNPINNMHTFVNAMRAAIEDIKGTRWWVPTGNAAGGSIQERVAFEDFYVDLIVEGFDTNVSGARIVVQDGVAYVNGKRLVVNAGTSVTLADLQVAYIDIVHATDSSLARIDIKITANGAPAPSVPTNGARLYIFKYADSAGSAQLVRDLRQRDLRMRYPKGKDQSLIIGSDAPNTRGELELTHLGGMTVRTESGSSPVTFETCDENERGLNQMRARGTLGAREEVSSNDTVGGFTGSGYIGNGYQELGRVRLQRDEGAGPRGKLSVDLTGAQGPFEAMQINSEGKARITNISEDSDTIAGLKVDHKFTPREITPTGLFVESEVDSRDGAFIRGALVSVSRTNGEQASELVGVDVEVGNIGGKRITDVYGARIKFAQREGGEVQKAVGLEIDVNGSTEPGNTINNGAAIMTRPPVGDFNGFTQISLARVQPELNGFSIFSADERRALLNGPLSSEGYYNDLKHFDEDSAIAGGSKAVVLRLPRAPLGEGSDLPWERGTYVATIRGQEGVVRPMRRNDLTPVGVLTKTSMPDDPYVEVAISGVVLAAINEPIEYGQYLYATVPAFLPQFSGLIVGTPTPGIVLPWTTIRIRIGTALFSKTTDEDELRPVLLAPVFDLS